MSTETDKRATTSDDIAADAVAPKTTIGRLAGVGPTGEILVRTVAADAEPVPARLLAGLDRALLGRAEMAGSEVLLLFLEHDPRRPVIVGLLAEEHVVADLRQVPDEIRVDGRQIHLEAYDEIVLRCGESSLVLRADGKVTLKGKHVLSQAKVTQRIKGGSVEIN